MPDEAVTPRGDLAIRTVAMPGDTNPSGDIFGGWLMSQMDIAGGVAAGERAKGQIATVAVNGMALHRPVHVGDVLSCFTKIQGVGTTSVTILVEAWARRRETGEDIKVTEGVFVYVALDSEGRKRPVPPE